MSKEQRPDMHESESTPDRDSEDFITKNMNIGEAVMKHREIAFVMMKYGLHCIGCHVSAFESIEQGCRAHGMDDETIDNMVKEINQVIRENMNIGSESKATNNFE